MRFPLTRMSIIKKTGDKKFWHVSEKMEKAKTQSSTKHTIQLLRKLEEGLTNLKRNHHTVLQSMFWLSGCVSEVDKISFSKR